MEVHDRVTNTTVFNDDFGIIFEDNFQNLKTLTATFSESNADLLDVFMRIKFISNIIFINFCFCFFNFFFNFFFYCMLLIDILELC
jgi:hypothetical protein